MSINIRTKGRTAEQDIATDLNSVLNVLRMKKGIPFPDKPTVQRNQNQSAVGGQDLVGTLGFAIEVKRQEQLNINTWWRQCIASAKTLGEDPVLLFRQNHQKWRCLMLAEVRTNDSVRMTLRVEIDYQDFLALFQARAEAYLDREQSSKATGVKEGSLFDHV